MGRAFRVKTFACLGLGGLALGLPTAAGAQSAEAFYSKNNMRMIIGTDVGGSFDMMGRLTARHIDRHIPGKPSIVIQNMPGGGSLLATNHIYNVAPRDGTVLGAVVPGVILTALFKDSTARYDPTKMNWVGNAMDVTAVPMLFHTAPVKTLADIQKREVVMGAGGISSMDSTNAHMLNAFLGTKIKVVMGYKGGEAINLAMERGEVHGRASSAWSAWKSVRPDWVRDKKMVPLVQIAHKPVDDPQLRGVPLLIDLVKESDRQLARAYTSVVVLGRPMLMGPDVPADRVAAVRKAYGAMLKDPAFLAEARKQRVDLNPIEGEDLQKMVGEIFALPAPQVARLESIIGSKNKKKKKK